MSGDAGGQERIEPPYGIILDEIRSGNAVPFLGAGSSLLPPRAGDSSLLPSGAELAHVLATAANFPSSDERDLCDLAKVASFYVDGSNRGALRRKLRQVFVNEKLRSNELHRLLASIATNLVIVTTNYDTLLEQAFIEAGKPYDLVVYPADNQEYANGVLWWKQDEEEPRKLKSNQFDIEDISGKTVIYKMHGSVRRAESKWDSFVITEEDYVRFLSRMTNAVPAAFREYFSKRAFLFLGYGLRDWNMRVLLREVSVSEITSWAILQNPSILERKLWERRRVDIFDLSLEEFVSNMQQVMNG